MTQSKGYSQKQCSSVYCCLHRNAHIKGPSEFYIDFLISPFKVVLHFYLLIGIRGGMWIMPCMWGQRTACLQKPVLSIYRLISRGQGQAFGLAAGTFTHWTISLIPYSQFNLYSSCVHCTELPRVMSFGVLHNFIWLFGWIYIFMLEEVKKKTYWKPYDLHCGSFRKKNECFGGQSFKYWPLNYAWSSSIGKGFVSWAVRARLLVWGDSRSLEGCSWNASTLLPLHQVALWQPFSSTAVDEYRMPRQYRMLPGFFYKAGGFIWPLGFSERSVTHWQERGSSVCPHTPSSSCPHAYYSDPCRCWEGELIFIWKCSPPPPPEQINTWAVCLCGLLSFCTARLFCRERSMALIFSSLQQVMWGRALRWHYTDCGSGSSMAEIHSTLTRDTFHPWRAARSALPAVEHHSSGT